ncbi:MAG: serine/threonine protein kinase [Aureliella sp.]
MSPSSVELWQRISASQLASPMQCRAWAAEAAAGLSATEAIDGHRIAQRLVELGRLSQFQADVLLDGSNEPLVKHGWRILEPVNFSRGQPQDVRGAWVDWWAAAKSPTAATAWLRWLGADDLQQVEIRDANPALPLALRHSQVAHEHLQGVAAPEMAGGSLQLCVAPLSGVLLSGLCGGRPVAIDVVLPMLMQIADGLAALHTAGIVHGRVTPDRIVQGEDGQWRLLRDPLCGHTLDISGRPLGLLGQKLPSGSTAAHFMAPEFLVPAQAATPQSDIYSLGCTVWLMLSGKLPASGKKPEQILAAHAEAALDLRSLRALPDPLVRIVLHCLAKNPAARFADAGQLQTALAGATAAEPAAAPASPAVQATPTIQTAPNAQAAATVKPDATVKAAPPVPAAPAKSAPTMPAAAQKTSPGAAREVRTSTEQPAARSPSAKPNRAQVIQAEVITPQTTDAAENSSAEVVSADVVSAEVVPSAVAPRAGVPGKLVSAEVAPSAKPGANVSAARSAASPQPAASPRPAAVPRAGVRRPVTKRRKSNPWLPPLIGGGGVVVLLLVLLVINGGLGSSSGTKPVPAQPAAANASSSAAVAASAATEPTPPADPRTEFFDLVDDSSTALWAPPRPPEPLPLDLLPPGGQVFLALRPERLFSQPQAKELLALLDKDIGTFWQWLREESGVPAEELEQVVVAAYPGAGGTPQFVLRARLKQPQTLGQLKSLWKAPAETKLGEQVLLTSGARGYYVAQQPFVDSQNVVEFVAGPPELLGEAVELAGAAGPLTSQIEQLWKWSDRAADISLLVNPSFLFTEGRSIVERCPPRLAEQLQKWLSRDMRGAMLSTSLESQWYYELRLVGSSDRDAGAIGQKLTDALENLPQAVESWFVSESPHPYWRAVALRYPNMLRALAAQTRIGVENGQAVANGYLPAEAAPNLIYGSWIALQPAATVSLGASVGAAASAPPAAQTPLTPEQILDRPITVAVDQQGIEVVLQLIGEQANDGLPPGTKPLQFELDGAGFQRSGITRNQQIRDFKVESQPVRVALTELSKRGNPVAGITDLKSAEQKLLWILLPSPDGSTAPRISLTSREAALAAKHPLPAEFAPAP